MGPKNRSSTSTGKPGNRKIGNRFSIRDHFSGKGAAETAGAGAIGNTKALADV